MQWLNGETFVEITKGDFNRPEGIGRQWSESDLENFEFDDGDKIQVDPEYISECLAKAGFEFSGHLTDWGFQVWW